MKVKVLGINIDDLTSEEAVNQVKLLWHSGRQHYIVTPNPEIIIYARTDPKFREIVNQADLSVPDGVGLVWALRRVGRKVKRVSGADLANRLLQLAEEEGKTVFFLGGKKDIAQRAAQKMKKEYPKLRVVGAESGDPSDDEGTRALLGGQPIDLLLVGYGHPKQEYWINRNLKETSVKVAMAVGGTLDYWSGEVKRAPRLIRSLGMEWLFRLIRQPWRLKRQLALLEFVWLVVSGR